MEHRLVVCAESLDQLQPADQLVVHLLQEFHGLVRLLLELPFLLELLLQNGGPLGHALVAALRDVGQEDVKHAPQPLSLNVVAEILHPAGGPVPPENAVLHIVQVEAAVRDLFRNAPLHSLPVLGTDQPLEGAPGEGPELRHVPAAEDLEKGLIGVQDLPGGVLIDEEAAGHLVREALNLLGGGVFPVLEAPAGIQKILDQAMVFDHAERPLSFDGSIIPYLRAFVTTDFPKTSWGKQGAAGEAPPKTACRLLLKCGLTCRRGT